MNEDFVTFELAKKLKEKGFNDGCYKYYKGEELKWSNSPWLETRYNDYLPHITAAPTIYQVLKWLREEKSIFVEPCVLADADTDADGKVINEYTYWSFTVTNIETGDMIYFEYERIDDKRFDSYEQAALAGVNYCLENLV